MQVALPSGFVSYISNYKELAPLASTLLLSPSVSVRLNSLKLEMQTEAKNLEQHVPWCSEGIYLDQRPQFTFDPALHQGLYYVQDASSMALCAAVKQLSDMLGGATLRYLDACAAPGGKTTAAIASLPYGSLVVANEYDYKRAEILVENVAKWGYPECIVSRGDTSKFKKLKGFFDIVAVDAPCSGEGMMRKDRQAIDQWSENLVESCADLQREILVNGWTALKPGGFLIYSTCTFNRTENEENLEWLISQTDAEPIRIDILESESEIISGIGTDVPCYRFLPGNVKGEGLFLAVLRKPGKYQTANEPAQKAKKGNQANKSTLAQSWLDPSEDWEVDVIGDEAYALPKRHASSVKSLAAVLDLIMHGLHIASIKGKDCIPTQELALTLALSSEAFPKKEISYSQAIAYLQKQSIVLDDASKGYMLLTYKGFPLGFVKNLGSRSNNLYPKSWRILSQQIPSEAPDIISL